MVLDADDEPFELDESEMGGDPEPSDESAPAVHDGTFPVRFPFALGGGLSAPTPNVQVAGSPAPDGVVSLTAPTPIIGNTLEAADMAIAGRRAAQRNAATGGGFAAGVFPPFTAGGEPVNATIEGATAEATADGQPGAIEIGQVDVDGTGVLTRAVPAAAPSDAQTAGMYASVVRTRLLSQGVEHIAAANGIVHAMLDAGDPDTLNYALLEALLWEVDGLGNYIASLLETEPPPIGPAQASRAIGIIAFFAKALLAHGMGSGADALANEYELGQHLKEIVRLIAEALN